MTGSYWDETWNVVVGCDRVSKGCDGCFAIPTGNIRQANPHPAVAAAFAGTVRRRDGRLDWTGQVNMLEQRLEQPLRWRKPRRIYVTLLGDLFHDQVTAEFIAKVFAVMRAAEQHTFLLVTKRHGRMRSLLNSGDFRGLYNAELRNYAPGLSHDVWPVPNLHLGVSVEDQAAANLRIPALLETPAAVRWLSVEPLIDEVDLSPWLSEFEFDMAELGPDASAERIYRRRLAWIVVGGESQNSGGHEARPMHPDWARSVRDQAIAAGIPLWLKQWGEYLPVPVVDDDRMAGGRGYTLPGGGRNAAVIRERGPSRTFRSGATRPMRPGDRNGAGIMLDRDTMALRLGVKDAGRELDGRTWDMLPGDHYPEDPRGSGR